MGISLYDATVGGFVQTVAAVESILAKGADFAREHGLEPDTLLQARIHPDMYPLNFQLHSVCKHSIEAVRGAQSGSFGFSVAPTHGYAEWQRVIADVGAQLRVVTREEIDVLVGREVAVKVADPAPHFSVEAFLLSMSVPNLHFHATTAYDILRGKGVPLGKRDYLGSLRMRF